jgi:cbb3-type cytochrome oxidase subunit 3
MDENTLSSKASGLSKFNLLIIVIFIAGVAIYLSDQNKKKENAKNAIYALEQQVIELSSKVSAAEDKVKSIEDSTKDLIYKDFLVWKRGQIYLSE